MMRADSGRFRVMWQGDNETLAHTLLARAIATDTFPGLPRPRDTLLIQIAPDTRRFREWSGASAPEWGAAIAIPSEHRIVMQGSAAGSDAGDPIPALRHELAHLALHENLGDLPPRWFDEGYASWSAREWERDDALAASLGLILHGVPPLDSLDAGFSGGAVRAGMAYALSYRAVADLAALDSARGLSLFFARWREDANMDRAIREAFGITEASFEAQWRSRTMRRFGMLALLANLAAIGALIGILLTPLWIARKRRDRERLEAMRSAARASAIALLLDSAPRPPRPPDERPNGS